MNISHHFRVEIPHHRRGGFQLQGMLYAIQRESEFSRLQAVAAEKSSRHGICGSASRLYDRNVGSYKRKYGTMQDMSAPRSPLVTTRQGSSNRQTRIALFAGFGGLLILLGVFGLSAISFLSQIKIREEKIPRDASMALETAWTRSPLASCRAETLTAVQRCAADGVRSLHPRSCCSASPRTQAPIWTAMPELSATGRKSTGFSTPRRG